MLLSSWASKNGLSYSEVLLAAMNKTLSATQNGKIWMIDEKADAVVEWLHKYHPEIFTTVTRLDFISRFTDKEKISIASNPQSLILWLELLNFDKVNLADDRLISEVNGLQTLGVIDADRVKVILATS